MAYITTAVEGDTDEPIVRRLAERYGHQVAAVYIRRGKANLDERLGAYNNAARFSPWVVLRDFDHDAVCPAALVTSLLPHRSAHMYFRLAVRSVEAWLLADRAAVASFLGVAVAHVPAAPEQLANPKETLVSLARRSKKRAIREDFVPKPGSARLVGPGYSGRVIEFTLEHWNPEHAVHHAPSLRKCMSVLESITEPDEDH